MGNLLSVLLECGSTAPDISVFVDFENALPNETNEVELKLYNDAEDVLKNSERILSDIKSYKGISLKNHVYPVCDIRTIYKQHLLDSCCLSVAYFFTKATIISTSHLLRLVANH